MDELLIDTVTFKLTQAAFITRLLVTLGVGALIGLERQHTAMKEVKETFGGIRTFVLVAILGFMATMGYFVLSPWVYVGVFLVVAVLTGISYGITASRGDIGATTEFSAIITFLLGTLLFLGYIEISLVLTVLVLVLLSAKVQLHSIIGKITSDELVAFIRFVVLALLIVPFLPDATYGPFAVLNPREIGWVILLISGLELVGYVLMKLMDSRSGILLSGLLGGLLSSTVVTWVFAKKSKENDTYSLSCAVGILAASCIMILRVFIWVWVFNEALFRQVYWVFIPVLLVAVAVTLFFYFKGRGEGKADNFVQQGNPLHLQGAILFGFIYCVILLLVSYANEQLGDGGFLLSSAVAGLSDINAITISVAKLAGAKLDFSIAAKAVLLATISNTLVKMGIGIWAGSKALRRYLYVGYGLIVLVTLLMLLFFV